MRESYILQRGLLQRYIIEFNNYMIYILYGDNVIRAEDLLENNEDS